MAVPAVMVDDQGNRIPGKVSDAEIFAHPERHSRAVMQDIYKSPEFCAACHKANLPPMLNGYKWIRAFTAYDEWQNSKFSQRNPLTFYTADFTRTTGRKTACSPRIAGSPATPPFRSITASTNNSPKPSPSSRAAIISTSISSP
jgi:hypothetical protein